MISRADCTDFFASQEKTCVLVEELHRSGVLIELVHHQPANTVEESRALAHRPRGCHLKSLVLKDRTGQLYLLSVLEYRQVAMNKVRRDLGVKGSLSLLGADLVEKTLGVPPGAVSPLSVLNADPGSIIVIIDRDILAADLVNCAFTSNTLTAVVRPSRLLEFLAEKGFVPIIYGVGEE